MADFRFTITEDRYTPATIRFGLRGKSTAEAEKILREEYRKLQPIIAKREKRLVQAGFLDQQSMLTATGRAPRLTDIVGKSRPGTASEANINKLIHALTELERMYHSKTGTVTGARKAQSKTLTTLHKHGYGFVNASNIKQFGRFMDKMRSIYKGKMLDSERAAKAFSDALKEGGDVVKTAFEIYQEEEEEEE